MGGSVGKVFNPISSVAGAIPGVGKIAGPVIGAMTGGPLGFASSVAGNAIQGNYGSGGGSSGGGSSSTPMYANPNISYGTNTYQVGGNAVDVSPYFISGDKGVYNLLPALGQVNTGISSQSYKPASYIGRPQFIREQGFHKEGAYTPYEAYSDILSKMAGDEKALNAFRSAYNPVTPGFSQLASRNAGPFDTYVDYNLNKEVPNQSGLTYQQLAAYAAQQNNPFFLPYETTTNATPIAFTPSEQALASAPIISPYLYANAMRSQRQSNVPAPVTPAPVTPAPVTPAPVTPAPVTPAPVTPAPVTPAPVTSERISPYLSANARRKQQGLASLSQNRSPFRPVGKGIGRGTRR